MSSDEGFNPEMTSDEDFQAKFAALLDEYNINLAELCRRVGTSEADAREAIREGTYGLPQTSNTLQRLLAPFGLGIDYLLGTSSTPSHAPWQIAKHDQSCSPTRDQMVLSPIDQRRALRTLTWQFNIRNNVPRPHRRIFATYIVEQYGAKLGHTLVRAARPGAPRSMTDFAYIYNRLLRQGFFLE